MIVIITIVIVVFISLLVAFVGITFWLSSKYQKEILGEKFNNIKLKLINANYIAQSLRDINFQTVELDIPLVEIVEIRIPSEKNIINESITSFIEDEKKVVVDKVKEIKTLEPTYSFVFQEV